MRFNIDYMQGVMEFDGVPLESMDETERRRCVMNLYYSLEATERELKDARVEIRNAGFISNLQFFVMFAIIILEIIRN